MPQAVNGYPSLRRGGPAIQGTRPGDFQPGRLPSAGDAFRTFPDMAPANNDNSRWAWRAGAAMLGRTLLRRVPIVAAVEVLTEFERRRRESIARPPLTPPWLYPPPGIDPVTGGWSVVQTCEAECVISGCPATPFNTQHPHGVVVHCGGTASQFGDFVTDWPNTFAFTRSSVFPPGVLGDPYFTKGVISYGRQVGVAFTPAPLELPVVVVPTPQVRPQRLPRYREVAEPDARRDPLRAPNPRSVTVELSSQGVRIARASSPRRPPRDGGMHERKFVANLSGFTTLGRVVSHFTEALDFAECLYDAVPKSAKPRGKKPLPVERYKIAAGYAASLIDTGKEGQLGDFIADVMQCHVTNQIKDRFFAAVGKAVGKASRRGMPWRPVGIQTGRFGWPSTFN